MKRTTSLYLAAASLVLTGAAFAQGPPAGAPAGPTGPAAEVLRSFKTQETNIVKAAEKMPAEEYTFKMTPDVRTYARIVNHVTEAQFRTCTTLNGTKMDPASVPSDTAGKDAVIAGLKASFAECDKAYGALTDANVLEALSMGPMKRSRIGLAWGNVSHDNEQYAQLSLYLRLKNLVPPTAEK